MAAISTSDIKNGITLLVDNGLFSVIEFQHVKPGKGGAFVRTKLRNARTGAVIERTYRSDERLEQAIIDKRDTQYLYRDGDDYIFMDQSNYDQVPVSSKSLGGASNFLVETGKAMLILHNDEIIVGGTNDCRDRTGHSGRPRVGRAQVRHARNRLCRAGSPLRWSR
jgi:elongation factor P